MLSGTRHNSDQEFKKPLVWDDPEPSTSHSHISDNEGSKPLFFDDFEPSDTPQPPTFWNRWGSRIVSLGSAAGLAGSIALRYLNLSAGSNVLFTLKAGAFGQSLISNLAGKARISRVRQICLTAFGQFSMFALTQGYLNTNSEKTQAILNDSIIALFGANIQLISQWFYQNPVRNESSSIGRGETCLKTLRIVPQEVTHIAKAVLGISGIVWSFWIKDPIAKGLSLFAGAFFISQIAGEKALQKLDAKIIKEDPKSTDDVLFHKGTCWRPFKSALLAVANIGTFLSFVPWGAVPNTEARRRQLGFVGAALGLCSGFAEESEKRRIENIPMEKLDEFHEIYPPLSSCLNRIWQITVPVISSLAMLGFTVWQEVDQLSDSDAKYGIALTCGGFISSYTACAVADFMWSKETRSLARDRLMNFVWVNPRILGIPPLFIYLAGTNSIRMDSDAIEENSSPFRLATVITSWFCYGIAMGRELYVSASNRKGSPQINFPIMAMSNAAISSKLGAAGVIPA